MPSATDRVWVTFAGPQATSLLSGEEVRHTPYIAPRDARSLARNVSAAREIVGTLRPSAVLSTGSGIALAFLPLAAAQGIPAHYVESAARSSGPSLTGRLLGGVPGIRRYTQDPRWSGARWRFRGSVLDGFAGAPRVPAPAAINKVVVTLGTIAPYGFGRLLRRLTSILPPEAEVLWQTGSTRVRGAGVAARPIVPADELDAAMAHADLVVAHAGLGTALSAFRAGVCPVLVPRERAFGEHVDDHQVVMAGELSSRGLCVSARVDELGVDDLERAASRRVVRVDEPPSFLLDV